MVVFLLRFDLSHDKARRHSGCRRACSFGQGPLSAVFEYHGFPADIDLVVGAGDCNLLAYFGCARGGESRSR